jgi:magnesium transporter
MFTIYAQLSEREFMKTVSFEVMIIYLNDPKSVFWIDIENPTEEEIEQIQEVFNFHPLCIEDCLYYPNSPKIDEFDSYLFIIVNEPVYDKENNELIRDEIDFFLGKNFLVSVHKTPNEAITKVKNRCQTELILHQAVRYQRGGRLRSVVKDNMMFRNSDFILHAILDTMVDSCFPMVDHWDDQIDDMEEKMFGTGGDQEVLTQVLIIKRQLTQFRRIIAPQRDILARIIHINNKAISKISQVYFRDIFDHLIRLNETIDSHRDAVSGIVESYYSYQTHQMTESSNRINVVMQRLTIITTIFMPLSFIAGVYGMNFDTSASSWNMPELKWIFGYPFALGIMAGVALFMYFFFRKRKWF